MTPDEVLVILEGMGGVRGPSCAAIPEGLRFWECCGSRSARYHYQEFIAREPGGGEHHVTLDLTPDAGGVKRISYGQEGYHHRTGTPFCDPPAA